MDVMVAGQNYPGSSILSTQLKWRGHFQTKKALSCEYRKTMADVDKSVSTSNAKLIQIYKGRKSCTLEETPTDGL